MAKSNNRYMHPGDFIPVTLPRGRYCNANDLIAFEPGTYVGKTLHPAGLFDAFENSLVNTFEKWKNQPGVQLLRVHVKMPHWDEKTPHGHYYWVDAPDNLATTSVTAVTIPNEPARKSSMGFYFDGTQFDFEKYTQIMGGFVPAVINGNHLYCLDTISEIMKELGKWGATSPITLCGRETLNFNPYVREPAGLLVQTETRIGWIFFDGRHELSIGVNIVDVARILKMLEDDEKVRKKVFDGARIKHAIFIDGGSAMKAYIINSNNSTLTPDLLNRVAAGSRNGPGSDDKGLNLYTLLRLHF